MLLVWLWSRMGWSRAAVEEASDTDVQHLACRLRYKLLKRMLLVVLLARHFMRRHMRYAGL